MSLSNNFPNTSPTLMLDFINNDRLDTRITYTRNSPATYVSSSGMIKLVSNNTPRFEYDPVTLDSKGLLIEEDRINLFQYTRDFWNGYWAKRGNSNTISQMNSITAPDGTLTGTIMCDGSSNAQYIRLDTDNVMANGTIYTTSVFVKKKDSNTVQQQIYTKDPTSGTNTTGTLDFTTGVVTVTTSGSPTDYSAGATQHADGWWRFWVTANSGIGTGDGIAFNIRPGSGTIYGNGNNSIYLWGSQFEAGAFPTSYMPSLETFTSRSSSGTYYGSDGLIKTATTNEARYQYNPQNLTAPPVLLTEPAKANILLYSNSFVTAPWTLTNATLSANSSSTSSPDGTTNATVLIESAVTDSHYVQQDYASVIDTSYTFSVYAKAKERSRIRVYFAVNSFGVNQYANFDLLNGTVTLQFGNAKGHMIYVGNGWYRCCVTTIKSTTAATQPVQIVLLDPAGSTTSTYAGDGVSGIYIWGAQIEAGTQGNGYTATSYINTGAAQVARAVDVFTSVAQSRAQDTMALTDNNFTSWYNKEQGTFVWSGDILQQTRSQGFRVLSTGNDSLRGIGAQIDTRDSGPAYFVSRSTSGTTTITSPGFVTNNQIITMAGSYSNTSNVVAASFFGSTATDTAGYYAFGTENKLDIGGIGLITDTRISNYNGHQRKLVYYPVKVTNDQLSNLTKTLL